MCFSFPKACWVFGPNILLLMCRAQSRPATLGNDGTYSLPRGWAMDTRSTVHGQDIHPSLARETGGAGYSNRSLNSRKSLCPPMGSATLPCCPHAFTVLSGLASQPPREPRPPGTCSCLQPAMTPVLTHQNALARKEGEKVDVHLSNADQTSLLCLLLSTQGREVLHPWSQFLCVFPSFLFFLFSPLPMTPHSCFSPNSTRFTAEDRCHLPSLITQQQTAILLVCFGQLGLAVWIMQVGFGMQPGRTVN